jgi:hypothetical protein
MQRLVMQHPRLSLLRGIDDFEFSFLVMECTLIIIDVIVKFRFIINKMQFQDGVCRCNWIKDDSDYLKYHDEEWGVPQYDDQKLFIMD